MKKAILAVSFGTTIPEAEHTCIRPVEEALRTAYPDFVIRRAYTSGMIIRKLCRQNKTIDCVEEAIEKLESEGFDEIAIVPTTIIPGGEYDKILAAAKGHPVSEPLLADERDLDWCANLLAGIAASLDRPLLMMGHGTEHEADEIYARLRSKLPENIFLACLEGTYTLDSLLPALDALPGRKLAIMPLMLVAGSHARKHLTCESPDSWTSVLKDRGFDVSVRMQGLGALNDVQQRFIGKAARIIR